MADASGVHCRYAFPPLLSDIIKKDLGLSQAEIANSNIIALVATYVTQTLH